MRTNLIEMATSFAADKHKNQYRKEGSLLYISHLVAVALILQKYNFSDNVIAAGLLHDILEDTETPEEEILKIFGEDILNLILPVTNDDTLDWKSKKQKYVDTVRDSGTEVKAIALADKIHNMKSLLYTLENQGEKTWEYFNASKADKLWAEELQLHMFEQTFSGPVEMVEEYKKLLEELKAKYF